MDSEAKKIPWVLLFSLWAMFVSPEKVETAPQTVLEMHRFGPASCQALGANQARGCSLNLQT